MTSATTTTPRGTGGHRGARQGGGLVFFACVLLLVVGFFNIIEGIAAIANSHRRGHSGALRPVRLRQPRKPGRLTRASGRIAVARSLGPCSGLHGF